MKDAEIIINDVVKGEYDLPRQFAPVIHEIPDVTSKNAGKSLTVDKDGRPTWGEGGLSEIKWADIKDKPGGYDRETIVTVTDETITSGNMFANYSDVHNSLMNRKGAPITVIFDGAVYECTVDSENAWGPFYVGDPNYAEYPFYIYANVFIDQAIYNPAHFRAADDASHTVKIEKMQTTPVVFDKKYIPDIQTLTGSTTFDSGKFLTVDTDGKPTWTRISNAEGGSY